MLIVPCFQKYSSSLKAFLMRCCLRRCVCGRNNQPAAFMKCCSANTPRHYSFQCLPMNLPVVFAKQFENFPSGTFSNLCGRVLANYIICYYNSEAVAVQFKIIFSEYPLNQNSPFDLGQHANTFRTFLSSDPHSDPHLGHNKGQGRCIPNGLQWMFD